MTEVYVKANPKAEVISPDLTIDALNAELSRRRMRIEQLVVLLRRNVCHRDAAIDEVPLGGRVCLWCGKHECAQAREFLDANF